MAISPSPQVPDLGFRNRESGHSGITQHTPRPWCRSVSAGQGVALEGEPLRAVGVDAGLERRLQCDLADIEGVD